MPWVLFDRSFISPLICNLLLMFESNAFAVTVAVQRYCQNITFETVILLFMMFWSSCPHGLALRNVDDESVKHCNGLSCFSRNVLKTPCATLFKDRSCHHVEGFHFHLSV